MTEGKCAIWGTPATISNNGGQPEYDSPRAGGKYRLGTRYADDFGYRSDEFKAKLTSWLIERRLSGFESPDFSGSGEFYETINSRKLLSISERVRRFFLYCIQKNIRPGKEIYNFKKSKNDPLGDESGVVEEDIYAWTECLNFKEFIFFRRILVKSELIEGLGETVAESDNLTFKGYEKLEELELTNTNSKQAFVAMWFDKSMDDIYDKAIEPAIREAGYEPRIIRKVEHNNKIDDEIIAELRRSRFVVADFTSAIHERDGKPEAIARGGVYYEAGFAHGMGIPVIWTCRSDMIGLVHFDTRQYNHIDWIDEADLKKRLYDRIRATIT